MPLGFWRGLLIENHRGLARHAAINGRHIADFTQQNHLEPQQHRTYIDVLGKPLQRKRGLVIQHRVRVVVFGQPRQQFGHVVAGIEAMEIAAGGPKSGDQLGFGEEIKGIG